MRKFIFGCVFAVPGIIGFLAGVIVTAMLEGFVTGACLFQACVEWVESDGR